MTTLVCAHTFTSSTRKMDRKSSLALGSSSSTTALGFCSVAVALVIITSNKNNPIGRGGNNSSEFLIEDDDGSSSTPSLTLLVLLVSVLVVYATDFGKNASWLSLARKVDDAVLRAVTSNQTLTRITSSVSASSLRFVEFAATHLGHVKRHAVDSAVRRTIQIAGRDFDFLTSTEVADLSLADLGDLARFATDMNRLDFNKREFLATVSERVQAASIAISKVIASSRGSKVSISTPPILKSAKDTTTMEDTDALAFVAFCRIFAEWRSERLVPPGYGRYAAGMALAKRDLVQNLQKIETAVHLYLNDMETRNGAAVDFANGRQLSSPTLGGLLRWEKAQGVHPRLPNLTDRSGASGLLWTQRQLQYQIAVFNNLLLVPSEFLTSKDAVNAAYKSTYDLYHGFIIKQMFQGSFDAAPDVSVILKHMNIGPKRTTSNDMDDITTSTSISESSSSQESSASQSAPSQAIPASISTAKTPLEVVAGHFTNEWVKIERFLKQCSGQQHHSQSRNLLMVIPEEEPAGVVVNEAEPKRDCSIAVTRPPTSKQTSEEEIPAFVAVVQPMLTELKALVIKLNMNDPSKC